MQITNMTPLLQKAMAEGYGVGAFSPRSTLLIEAILSAAENRRSPVIVQISANEFEWFGIGAGDFARRFFELADRFSVSAALHLDHTRDIPAIVRAMDAGFSSVMIDASAAAFEENAALTRQLVELAHPRNVSVEAELGRIGGADKLETGDDAQFYTVPEEAAEFVRITGVDALAVSIGTAHGVYPVKNPAIDLDRLSRIRELVSIPLVLHGGSGLPPETVKKTIQNNGRPGVSKINIATDLEQAFLKALGREKRMTNREIESLPPGEKETALEQVRLLVEDRMENYVFSAGRL